MAITIGVVFVICFGMRITGIHDSFFYRPNARTYAPPADGWPAHRQVDFQSFGGTNLKGWFFPGDTESETTVTHFHGSDGNITGTARNLLWLHEAGFNLFVFDYRGYGASEGNPTRAGVVDDARAAYRLVQSGAIPEVDPDRIVFFGQSMGGQLAIRTAVQQSPAPLAVISEVTYASYADHIFDKMGQITFASPFKWPTWLVADDAYSADQVVANITCPLLLVHGTNDKGVRHHHSERLYELASEPKQLWLIEDAAHLRIFKHSPYRNTYRPRLIAYLRDLAP